MRLSFPVAVAALLLSATPAFAEPITFEFRYTGVDIGYAGQVYRGGAISLFLSGDTKDVAAGFRPEGPIYVFHTSTASFAIDGGPSGALPEGLGFVFQAYSNNIDLYRDSAMTRTFSYAGYGLPRDYQARTTIGTSPGSLIGGLNGGLTAPLGGIGVFDTPTTRITFKSTVTPEPSSVVMAGIAMATVVGMARGCRRAEAA